MKTQRKKNEEWLDKYSLDNNIGALAYLSIVLSIAVLLLVVFK